MNPFRPTRFEKDSKPIIRLYPQVEALEEAESIYVQGTRGSGKTSLLAALHWKQRLENESLQPQLKGKPGFDRFLGIYLRFPEFLANEFEEFDWSHLHLLQNPDVIEEQCFQLFIQLHVMRELVEAVSALTSVGIYKLATSVDSHVCSALATLLDALALPLTLNQKTYSTTRGVVERLQGACDFLSLIQTRGASPAEFERIPFHLARRILREYVPALLSGLSASPSIHLKVCLDESETLTPRQQTFLNSLVRLAKSPITWVISFTSGSYETVRTTIPSQSLSDADRRILNLDTVSEPMFLRLCEDVSAMRFWYSESAEERDDASKLASILGNRYFRVRDVLGVTHINKLISQLLASPRLSARGESIESIASRIAPLMNYKEFQTLHEPSGHDSFAEQEGPFQQKPLWQAYVLARLNRLQSASVAKSKDDRARLAAALRRKQRAALLLFCRELRVQVPYSGWQVVLALSDKCIRDYLDIMGAIYDQRVRSSKISALQFRQGTVPTEEQRAGIVRASWQKLEGIAKRTERYPKEAFKLVSCLGALQKRLQLGPTVEEALRNPERGNFRVNFSTDSGGYGEGVTGVTHEGIALAKSVLAECEVHGYLKPIAKRSMDERLRDLVSEREADERHFRLHRRFGPLFGYSYRGPYGDVPIPVDEIVAICVDPTAIDAAQWAERVMTRIAPRYAGQFGLFEEI